MYKPAPITDEIAQVIALKALKFLVNDEERVNRFMAVTGLTPDEIRARAAQRDFHDGILQHLRSDQTLLLMFAESEGLAPSFIDAASLRLSGPTT